MTAVRLMSEAMDLGSLLEWHFAPPEDTFASHRLTYVVAERSFELSHLIDPATYKHRGPDLTLDYILTMLPDEERAKAAAASITRTSKRR
ncbi:hypothetical protein [Shinella sp. JR1-6]|uniref:hypothetical protein n=1 Tax=Shinella sp. JR1-6 TaxID=2527671 RepID=UPI00102D4E86|nr:hypothetical protein [Shinella sp. JR1-6]TAA54599.1 hypothetical protein EXZ48_26605 [Shinella sp. JR1-6]